MSVLISYDANESVIVIKTKNVIEATMLNVISCRSDSPDTFDTCCTFGS